MFLVAYLINVVFFYLFFFSFCFTSVSSFSSLSNKVLQLLELKKNFFLQSSSSWKHNQRAIIMQLQCIILVLVCFFFFFSYIGSLTVHSVFISDYGFCVRSSTVKYVGFFFFSVKSCQPIFIVYFYTRKFCFFFCSVQYLLWLRTIEGLRFVQTMLAEGFISKILLPFFFSGLFFFSFMVIFLYDQICLFTPCRLVLKLLRCLFSYHCITCVNLLHMQIVLPVFLVTCMSPTCL